MMVSTFGAPKVGNRSFRKLYEEVVHQHWRVEISLDLVPRLPWMPYEHTGKQVLLTPGGDLFLDPNPLDMQVYKEQSFQLAYHTKVSSLALVPSAHFCECTP